MPDNCEIYDGLVVDCNQNHIPDVCDLIAAGDFDGDGDVDCDDFLALAGSLAGPDVAVTTPGPECVSAHLAAFDFDWDGDEDLADLAAFQLSYTGGE